MQWQAVVHDRLTEDRRDEIELGESLRLHQSAREALGRGRCGIGLAGVQMKLHGFPRELPDARDAGCGASHAASPRRVPCGLETGPKGVAQQVVQTPAWRLAIEASDK